MENQLSLGARRQLDRFCRQYLQVQLELDYPDDEHLRNDAFQRSLYTRLFKEDSLKYAPPQRYQLRVLKELAKRIEESIQDWEEQGISDDLMNHLSTLFSSSIPSEVTSVQQKSYVTYTLSTLPSTSDGIPTITLLEARNLLAASGTTGLRTWEAALHFSTYLSQNPSLISGKSVLELGAGTGLLSILCAKYLRALHMLCTDGSESVVEAFPTNLYLNGLEGSSGIRAAELIWGHALVGTEDAQWNSGRKIDVVLGSDLTYDSTGFPALISTFNELIDLNPEVKILIAATVRNERTFEGFVETCSKRRLVVKRVEWETPHPGKQMGPFYDGAVPIRICDIRRKGEGG